MKVLVVWAATVDACCAATAHNSQLEHEDFTTINRYQTGTRTPQHLHHSLGPAMMMMMEASVIVADDDEADTQATRPAATERWYAVVTTALVVLVLPR